MKRNWLIAVASVAMAAGLSMSAAQAAPAAGLDVLKGTAGSLVEKTHQCHTACEWTRWRSWHRHIGPSCRRVACKPGPGWRYHKRCWWGPGGLKHCRFGF